MGEGAGSAAEALGRGCKECGGSERERLCDCSRRPLGERLHLLPLRHERPALVQRLLEARPVSVGPPLRAVAERESFLQRPPLPEARLHLAAR